MFELFERELKQLDIKLAAKSAPAEADQELFRKAAACHQQLAESDRSLQQAQAVSDSVKRQLEFAVLFSQLYEERPERQNLQEVAANFQQQQAAAEQEVEKLQASCQSTLEAISKTGQSKEFRGPCQLSLEPVLQQHNIQRQAYHSGAFVGNQIHQALTPEVITELTAAPHAVIVERGTFPNLQNDAQTLSNRFSSLMRKYAACRNIMSRVQPLPSRDCEQTRGTCERLSS